MLHRLGKWGRRRSLESAEAEYVVLHEESLGLERGEEERLRERHRVVSPVHFQLPSHHY
eukprot:CAMPEP_0180142196 /NCGR_PEP_ID=MMETSP0986-20121125/15426_1 /TAXON_ID=697907 /ORGANISM="non described non described, Strain CCMP2293" /LENGTH=58 /DNA_ID=CAMNT_0022085327 /DNA_START=90 /DNA_END=266 /DNA_ORIENTATION=-